MLPATAVEVLREAAVPLLDGTAGDYDPLLQILDGARVTVLGIATVGSHELFEARAALSRRLIVDLGFSSLRIDDPGLPTDAVDAYLIARTDINPARAVDPGLLRPSWTWRNAEMLDFLSWLRAYNDQFAQDRHKVRVRPLQADIDSRTLIWASAGDHLAIIGEVLHARFARLAALIGFTTYAGSVLSDIDGEPRVAQLPSAPSDSIEAELHAIRMSRFMLCLRDAPERVAGALRGTAAEHFDALIHFDYSRALEPLA
jgi:erythromycin esterase-like protein